MKKHKVLVIEVSRTFKTELENLLNDGWVIENEVITHNNSMYDTGLLILSKDDTSYNSNPTLIELTLLNDVKICINKSDIKCINDSDTGIDATEVILYKIKSSSSLGARSLEYPIHVKESVECIENMIKNDGK